MQWDCVDVSKQRRAAEKVGGMLMRKEELIKAGSVSRLELNPELFLSSVCFILCVLYTLLHGWSTPERSDQIHSTVFLVIISRESAPNRAVGKEIILQ